MFGKKKKIEDIKVTSSLDQYDKNNMIVREFYSERGLELLVEGVAELVKLLDNLNEIETKLLLDVVEGQGVESLLSMISRVMMFGEKRTSLYDPDYYYKIQMGEINIKTETSKCLLRKYDQANDRTRNQLENTYKLVVKFFDKKDMDIPGKLLTFFHLAPVNFISAIIREESSSARFAKEDKV